MLAKHHYDIVCYAGPGADNNGDGVGGPEVVILLVLVLEVLRMMLMVILVSLLTAD